MRILYFAWLRERVGMAEEELELPAAVRNVQELIDWLRQRSPRHSEAFGDQGLVRCAVDQDFAALDAPVGQAREIAFFPPVTGG